MSTSKPDKSGKAATIQGKPGVAKAVSVTAVSAKATAAKGAVAKVAVHRMSSDFVLGAGGCCLAAASAAFGIGMTMHGPDSSLGKSKDFTVFAQLTHRDDRPTVIAAREPFAGQSLPRPHAADDLDMTATASIPGTVVSPSSGKVISTVRVESVDGETATIWVAGRSQTVRVGDSVPGAGTVLEIEPGGTPIVRTSKGLILADKQ